MSNDPTKAVPAEVTDGATESESTPQKKTRTRKRKKTTAKAAPANKSTRRTRKKTAAVEDSPDAAAEQQELTFADEAKQAAEEAIAEETAKETVDETAAEVGVKEAEEAGAEEAGAEAAEAQAAEAQAAEAEEAGAEEAGEAGEQEAPVDERTFEDLNLQPEILQALDEMGYENPMPVQLAVYDQMVAGKDIMVQSRTGTGKTAGFGIPIVQQVDARSAGAQVLILAPTRELARQVWRELERISMQKGLTVVPVYGGAPMKPQIDALKAGAQIVAGTPGRVHDHLRRGTLKGDDIRVLVLDECDEMLSMGFQEEIEKIIGYLPPKEERQTVLFSATIPDEIQRIARRHMNEPAEISLSEGGVSVEEIEHYYYVVSGMARSRDLLKVLKTEAPESAIIFCNTREDTNTVARFLRRHGYDAEAISSDLSQNDRERVMKRMRDGNLDFLVATDVAARGIDISGLSHVINFTFPESPEVYVHRTGRTGRAGKSGVAVSLVGPRELSSFYYLKLIYKIRPEERDLPSADEMSAILEGERYRDVVKRVAEEPADEYRSLARRIWQSTEGERVVGYLLQELLTRKAAKPAKPRPEREARPEREERPRREARPEREAREERPRREARAEREERPRREERAEREERPRREERAEREERPRREEREARPEREAREERKRESRAEREERRRAEREERKERRRAEREERKRPEREERAEAVEAQEAPPAEEEKPRRKRRRRDEEVAPVVVEPEQVALESAAAPSAVAEGSAYDPSNPDTREFWEAWADEVTVQRAARKETRAASSSDSSDKRASTARLYVNLGKREDITAADVRELLGKGMGKDAGKIGSVALRNTHCYVRVPEELVDKIIVKSEGKVYKERELVVERARR